MQVVLGFALAFFAAHRDERRRIRAARSKAKGSVGARV